jgi:hypothetical protein
VRFPATLFAAALAAGLFAGAVAAPCRADVRTEAVPSVAAQAPDSKSLPAPGEKEEERNYAQREAASPRAQEFTGGWLLELLIIVALVVIILLLV